MAYSRSRRSASNRGRGRVSYRSGRRAAPARARSVRGNRAGARQQVVKLVLGFDGSVGSQGAFRPGVPGTVGISQQPPGGGKAKF